MSKLVGLLKLVWVFLVQHRTAAIVIGVAATLLILALRWAWLWWVYLGILVGVLALAMWILWSIRDFKM